MSRFPGAHYRPLAGGHPAPMARHDIVCLHTMVGYLTSTEAMFRKNGWTGTESHFGVGGKWGLDASRGLDGTVYQWVDTAYRADANLNGNHRVISIETADNAPNFPSQIEPWTPKQMDALVKIVAWACRTHDIPAVLIPDSKPGRRGIGYHRLGCQHSRGLGVDGFLQVGGERWSNAVGKECPGSRRIAQIPELISRVRAELRPEPVKPASPSVQEDDMEWTDKVALTATDANIRNAYAKATGNTDAATFKAGDKVSVSDMVRYPTLSMKIFLEQIRINAKLDKLLAPEPEHTETP